MSFLGAHGLNFSDEGLCDDAGLGDFLRLQVCINLVEG